MTDSFVPALLALLAAACSTPAATTTSDAAPTASASPSLALSSDPAPPLPHPPSHRAERLAADARARAAAVLSLFDAGAPRVQVESDLFVLADVDAGSAFDKSVTLTRDYLGVLLDGRLGHLPYEAVTVWLFGTATRFNAFRDRRVRGARETPYGLYHPATREIFVNTAAAGVTTLTHELTHPLLEADFPRAPLWLVEGLSSLYELPDLTSEPGQIHGKPDQRRGDLLRALSSGLRKTVRLDALFDMSDSDFRNELEPLHYAMSREAVRWLDTKEHKLWPLYKAWRDDWLDDHGGEKAFLRLMGRTPAEASDDWLAWVESHEGGL